MKPVRGGQTEPKHRQQILLLRKAFFCNLINLQEIVSIVEDSTLFFKEIFFHAIQNAQTNDIKQNQIATRSIPYKFLSSSLSRLTRFSLSRSDVDWK